MPITEWRRNMTRTDASKLLRDVKKFSGEKNEDAAEFLETLNEIVLEGRMADLEILKSRLNTELRRVQSALPTIIRA